MTFLSLHLSCMYSPTNISKNNFLSIATKFMGYVMSIYNFKLFGTNMSLCIIFSSVSILYSTPSNRKRFPTIQNFS
jgi:hypothetical protein